MKRKNNERLLYDNCKDLILLALCVRHLLRCSVSTWGSLFFILLKRSRGQFGVGEEKKGTSSIMFCLLTLFLEGVGRWTMDLVRYAVYLCSLHDGAKISIQYSARQTEIRICNTCPLSISFSHYRVMSCQPSYMYIYV